ncbi:MULTISPECIES: NAD(P)H-binding protein [unclassified Streptomyces]|uniref:NAD(P)H-binding protein n=1 Tax=unclassified Streptomyces TaxID=2593676 RepID=UPI00190B1AB1|nr:MULTISPECIES: NAD(P)H-binding protein [unclassified Streptomyces]MBK3569661.1 NAD(P)H-binding protein [Streptomyces sp. MBT62]MBK6016266.1 NAD(P)H-binding protein [Streptomyces sp. MBT53]
MIVVTGATGNVGRTLVRILTEDRVPVTAVARNITGPGTVTADLAEPETLRGAFEGADALFLLMAGERPYDVLDTAKAAGVRKVVLVSSQGVGTRPEAYAQPRQFEAAVRESGLDWTILRPGGLDSNAFAWAESIRERRTAAAPFGDVGLPFVDPDDVAAVAATVLREEGHEGATYTLTGPAQTTPRARATAIAAALGEPVTFTEQTRAEAYDLMASFMPLPVVEGTLAILGEPTEEEQRVSPDVERVLGRAPGTFSAWAERNAAAFR